MHFKHWLLHAPNNSAGWQSKKSRCICAGNISVPGIPSSDSLLRSPNTVLSSYNIPVLILQRRQLWDCTLQVLHNVLLLSTSYLHDWASQNVCQYSGSMQSDFHLSTILIQDSFCSSPSKSGRIVRCYLKPLELFSYPHHNEDVLATERNTNGKKKNLSLVLFTSTKVLAQLTWTKLTGYGWEGHCYIAAKK